MSGMQTVPSQDACWTASDDFPDENWPAQEQVTTMPGSRFDPVADDYDAGRPSYPDEFFAAVEEITGPLAGQLVLDGGAGTGIATRQLTARGARVAGYDIAERMLRRARARSPELSFVLGDGSRLPFRDRCADLACFAQSWHWLDHEDASREVARVLRPGGHWAAWWNHAAADGEEWFAAYQDAKELACPLYRRSRAATDRSAEAIGRTGLFWPGASITVPWTRTLAAQDWITDERSKSYVNAVPSAEREHLLAEVARIVGERFPDGQMKVSYVTRAWIARRR
jgi:ubiquinone/menaquinone biosynthesis C-methylase UbiE